MVLSVSVLAACDNDEAVAPKPAAVPTAAQPQLLPGKTGNLVIKTLDQNQNILTQTMASFEINAPSKTWWANDNMDADADTSTGVLVYKSLVPGSYKVCVFSTPSGYGLVGSRCQYTQVYAGSTSGLFFTYAPEAVLKWTTALDNPWNYVGGATFRVDSNNVTYQYVTDNVPSDVDPAPGVFQIPIWFEGTWTVCVDKLPAGFVLAPNQPPCKSKDVKMNTGWHLGPFFIVPIFSARWNVTDGLSLIGPSTFKVQSGLIDIDVVDNGVNDYNPVLGELGVKLPKAADYSICEIVPPANHWNATPSCKRVTVVQGVPTAAGTFVNPEKQVYYPGGRD
jgi:hypothetical protein